MVATGAPSAPAGFGPLRHDRGSQWLLLITLLAGAFRFWRLGAWSLWSDELFTLVKSTTAFSWLDVRPLGFALNHYVTIPLFGETAWSLRLVPALTGTIAVPVLGYLVGRVYGKRSGLLAALITAVAPFLIYHAQFARYYPPSYLAAILVAFGGYGWLCGQGRRWLWLALGAALVGWLFVPTTILVVPGLVLWYAWNIRELGGGPLLDRLRTHRLLVGAVVVLGGLALIGFMQWMGSYTGNLGPVRPYPFWRLPLSMVGQITVPITLLILGGLVLAWTDRDLGRPARTFLPLATVGSIVPLVIIYPVAFVHPHHFVTITFLWFSVAAVGLARLTVALSPLLLRVVLVTVVLGSTSREFVSYYVDGSRYDYRRAALVTGELVAELPGPVYTTGNQLLAHYAPQLEIHELDNVPGRPVPWEADSVHGPVWIVVPEGRGGLEFAEPRRSQILSTCRTARRIGRQRYDYFDYIVVIMECPPGGTASTSAPGG